MMLRLALVGMVLVGGCGVESPDVSSTQQDVARNVLARFRNTGVGAAFVGSTNGPPWMSQYVTISRYVTDAVPPPVGLSFGGGWQDPSSLYLGPYGYYYAAGYVDYAYGTVPLSDGQLSSNNARLHTTVPANSDTFYSERCYYDHRVGSYDCVSLDGQTIDVTWESTGEIDTVNGLQEYDFGSLLIRLTGRSTFSMAHATGTLVGTPLQNEEFTYITADRGADFWFEVDR